MRRVAGGQPTFPGDGLKADNGPSDNDLILGALEGWANIIETGNFSFSAKDFSEWQDKLPKLTEYQKKILIRIRKLQERFKSC